MVKTHKYTCKTCDYRTNDKRDLGKHKQTKKHYSSNMICFNCKMAYKRVNHYNNHMSNMPCMKDEEEQKVDAEDAQSEAAPRDGVSIFQLDTRTLSAESFQQVCRLLNIDVNPLMQFGPIARTKNNI